MGIAFTLAHLLFGALSVTCPAPALCAAYLLCLNIVRFLITFAIIVAMNANAERLRSRHSEGYVHFKLYNDNPIESFFANLCNLHVHVQAGIDC